MNAIPYLTESEAAGFLRLARGTLQNLRSAGSGPAFIKLGSRVVYRLEDLLAWAEARRRTSTSASARDGK